MNRNQYLREWKRAHQSYERSQYPNFKNALDEQVSAVVHYIKRHGLVGLDTHLTVLVSPQPISEAYQKCYTRVGTLEAGRVYEKIQKAGKKATVHETKDAPSFFSEQWRKLMSLFFNTDAGQRITDVTDTTRNRITGLLADSQDLPISERATYITDQLDDPDFNRSRALVIARTESTAAANYGASLGADSADYELDKQWLAVDDANTRPTHLDADGQLVDVADTFTVGGFDAMYPGDLTLPAQEVINCRCCAMYVPRLNANGVPILK